MGSTPILSTGFHYGFYPVLDFGTQYSLAVSTAGAFLNTLNKHNMKTNQYLSAIAFVLLIASLIVQYSAVLSAVLFLLFFFHTSWSITKLQQSQFKTKS